jgi:hypothetical protein
VLTTLWMRFIAVAERVRHEERGDSLVNWLVLTVGLAAAAAVVVALLRPAIESAAEQIVDAIAGSKRIRCAPRSQRCAQSEATA